MPKEVKYSSNLFAIIWEMFDSRQLQEEIVAERAKSAMLADELKSAQDYGKSIAVSFAEVQKQALDLAVRLNAANKARNDEAAKVADLQRRFEESQDSVIRLGAALNASKMESAALCDDLAKSRAEIAAERTKGEQLTKALADAEAKVSSLTMELEQAYAEIEKVKKDNDNRLAQLLAEAKRHADELAGERKKAQVEAAAQLKIAQDAVYATQTKANAAKAKADAAKAKAENLRKQLDAAERKIAKLQEVKKVKEPFRNLFGGDSQADFSVLEQAARRELSAMKRTPNPRHFPKAGNDVIDI